MTVGTATAQVPAKRPLTGYVTVNLDRLMHMLTLCGLVNELVVEPTITMARNLPARFLHCVDDVRVALQGHRNSENRYRHLPVREQSMQAPKAGTGSIFVDGFHVHVPLAGIGARTHDFREKRFGRVVSVQHTALGALLVVDDELHSDARAGRPCNLRWICTVTGQVSRISLIAHSCCNLRWYQASIRSRSSSLIWVRLPIGITLSTTVC